MNYSGQQELGFPLLGQAALSGVQDAPFLQPFWDMVRDQEGWMRSPLFPVLFSFTAYVLFCIPFMALDLVSTLVPALRKLKIQPQSSPSAEVLLCCLLQTIYNHVVFIFPVTLAHWYWRPVHLPLVAPGLSAMILDVVACLLLFDFQYFVWHLVHHRVPWLYKTFHKFHHKHTSTFALSTHYSSAWETLSLGLFAGACPMVLRCHPLTEMAFFVTNIWLSVEDHSGYDLPWSVHRLVPFGLCGGAPHHDLHHLTFRSNYAPYFTHWDKLWGTFRDSHSKD
ncbi:cholesterol 25-hydroxylase [Ambystoma mexicanum]|uniref:cholesterol 25-hydroxylase n=1 Tax=Ambystoma mexicanum TaxID=8296 RepID=UPI0037E8C3A9